MEKKTGEKKITNEKPLSLYPFKPDEVLKKFLQIPAPTKKPKKKRKTRLP